MGGGQTLEQLTINVEWPIFRTSEISNIKRTKDDLIDFINFDLKKKNYNCLNYLNTQNIWLILVKLEIYGI